MGGLRISGLKVEVEGKEVVSGVDLEVSGREIHGLMGPNGSGKSSLALALMGHPRYEVKEGKVEFEGEDLLEMEPDERARRGLFLGFQTPVALPGVSVFRFLKNAYERVRGGKLEVKEFKKKLVEELEEVGLGEEFLQRNVNEGFSGGERKKMEILQARMLEPSLVVLDEVDSGLDVDSLKVVAESVKKLVGQGSGVLVISHYPRLFEYLEPEKLYVMKEGEMFKEGGAELVEEIEKKGYEKLK